MTELQDITLTLVGTHLVLAVAAFYCGMGYQHYKSLQKRDNKGRWVKKEKPKVQARHVFGENNQFPPKICGNVWGNYYCQLEKGHEGSHQSYPRFSGSKP